jgi:hypothetical protein
MLTMMGNMMHVALSVPVQNVAQTMRVQLSHLRAINVSTLMEMENMMHVVKMVTDKLVAQIVAVMVSSSHQIDV